MGKEWTGRLEKEQKDGWSNSEGCKCTGSSPFFLERGKVEQGKAGKARQGKGRKDKEGRKEVKVLEGRVHVLVQSSLPVGSLSLSLYPLGLVVYPGEL